MLQMLLYSKLCGLIREKLRQKITLLKSFNKLKTH
jgi:hypothetical protein